MSQSVPRHQFELGRWNLTTLEQRIAAAQGYHACTGARAHYWARALRGTPFAYESALPPLAQADAIRVRLASFDCITYAYTVLALAQATDVADFLRRLYLWRYRALPGNTIDPDPRNGNFFDFACEALLLNATARHWLDDITQRLGPSSARTEVTMHLLGCRRSPDFDPHEQHIWPRWPEAQLRTPVVLGSRVGLIDWSQVKNGDLLLFTRGATDNQGQPRAFFVCHAAFVDWRDKVPSMLHATRNYYISRKHRTWTTLDGAPGAYVPGVIGSGRYLGDDRTIMHGGQRYFGYHAERPRSIADYARDNFFGLKVLRLRENTLKDYQQ